MTLHSEALTAAQSDLLATLGPAMERHGFYMVGGTALALQLGHRRSVDFDWFTTGRLEDPLRLAAALRDEGLPLTDPATAAGTLEGRIQDVRVTLIEYRYPKIGSSIPYPDAGCTLASLDDLAAMKLSAITQRGARKDFIDLWTLLQHHRPLPDLLDLYRKKYSVEDIGPVLVALAYFDDAETEPMPEMLRGVEWGVVRSEVERAVRSVSE